MEADCALGGLSFEVRRDITDLKRHSISPFLVRVFCFTSGPLKALIS
jgi:hypothetical protein